MFSSANMVLLELRYAQELELGIMISLWTFNMFWNITSRTIGVSNYIILTCTCFEWRCCQACLARFSKVEVVSRCHPSNCCLERVPYSHHRWGCIGLCAFTDCAQWKVKLQKSPPIKSRYVKIICQLQLFLRSGHRWYLILFSFKLNKEWQI